jgi:hypothetical protein
LVQAQAFAAAVGTFETSFDVRRSVAIGVKIRPSRTLAAIRATFDGDGLGTRAARQLY